MLKLLHISDLHIGKRLFEYSLIEDQKFILNQIVSLAEREKPDGVIIAGDIYDKSFPSAEAVSVFDDFLTALSETGASVFIIAGNHDSPERIAFGSRIMNKSNIYAAGSYEGKLDRVTLKDEYGEVDIYLLPFVRSANVRRFYGDDPLNLSDALKLVIESEPTDESRRSVLIAHQTVTGSVRSESESVFVGASESVDPEVFRKFDYVALGHIHRFQSFSGGRVCYSGTPMKYSFSEAGDEKGAAIVTLDGSGNVALTLAPLAPLREMYEIKGSYDTLMSLDFYRDTPYPDSYLHITLTDEEDVPDAAARLRTVYKFLMRIDYDNARTRTALLGEDFPDAAASEGEITPYESFSKFYEAQNGSPMSEGQSAIVKRLVDEIWEV